MQRLFHQLLIIFVVILYCSHAYLFFFNEGITGFKPLYWYVLTIGSAMVIAIFRLPSILPRKYSDFIVWLFVYLCFSIINYMYSSQSEAAEQALIVNIEMIGLLLAFLIIFQHDDTIRFVRLSLLLVVIFSVAMNYIDFFTPTWTRVTGRAAGLYENPTITGKVLVLAMVTSVPLLPQKFRLPYCLFVGTGVLITFSRGPWLFWFLALLGLTVTGCLVFKHKKIFVLFAGFLSAILLFILFTGVLLDYLSASGFANYLTPDTLIRLGAGGSAFADDSTGSRFDAALRAWSLFQDNPWLGAGLGYSMEVSEVGPHNMYLAMAADGGLLGLGIFVYLLFILFRMGDNIGKVLTIIYAASSLTSHNNLEQPALLVFIAFIVVTCKPERVVPSITLPWQRRNGLLFNETGV